VDKTDYKVNAYYIVTIAGHSTGHSRCRYL